MPKVFISYSQKDYFDVDGDPREGNAVDKIVSALNKAGISYWIDREYLKVGSTYATKITENIKACDIMLFLSSENANASEWTLREISLAKELGKRILPVRLDHSEYDDGVKLYLAAIQYIDWKSVGEKEALNRIIAKILDPSADITSEYEYGKIPLATQAVLYGALAFLTCTYAILSYQFLLVIRLKHTESEGGLLGFACEFGILLSIWYIFRLLRKRKCTFILPALTTFFMGMAGVLLFDKDPAVIICAGLLGLGWIAIAIACTFNSRTRKSLFKQMSREEVMMKISDPEIFLLLYLLVKSFIVVAGTVLVR